MIKNLPVSAKKAWILLFFATKLADKELKRQGLDGVFGGEMGGLCENMLYNMLLKSQ